jgi:F-type H+-transporting ATPase subunit epsilon
MNLRLLLPHQVFAEASDVSRVVAQTPQGSYGLLPQRRDCVASLAPGILIYETPAHGEVCIAVDEGALVKIGPDVTVSVRRALGGTDLGRLRETVQREFLAQHEDEQDLRRVMARLEAGFLRRLESLKRG